MHLWSYFSGLSPHLQAPLELHWAYLSTIHCSYRLHGPREYLYYLLHAKSIFLLSQVYCITLPCVLYGRWMGISVFCMHSILICGSFILLDRSMRWCLSCPSFCLRVQSISIPFGKCKFLYLFWLLLSCSHCIWISCYVTFLFMFLNLYICFCILAGRLAYCMW